MKRLALLPLLALATLALAKAGPNTATRLSHEAGRISDVAIRDIGSCPPSFRLALTLPMPTPGWKATVDSVSRTDDRIVVLMTTTPPKGMAAQVITPLQVPVDLGGLRKGRYLVEVRTRTGTGAYELIDALILRGS